MQIYTVWKSSLITQVGRDQQRVRIMKKQVNMTPPNEANKIQVTDPKEMEI